jgi:hypothetical protein
MGCVENKFDVSRQRPQKSIWVYLADMQDLKSLADKRARSIRRWETRENSYLSQEFSVRLTLMSSGDYRFTICFGTLSASNPPNTINAASIYIPLAFDAVTCFNHPTR